jgi:phenylpropionate dioxygenase-like ring-hydroxylating dioxygenase large terminal subunit
MREPPGDYRRVSVRGGAGTLPGPYYPDDVVFREEVERIFARHWLCLVRAEQIAAPGAYHVT